MGTLIVTIFACVFYTGRIWENGFLGCFGNANIQMSIAMCFLMGSVAAGIVCVTTGIMKASEVFEKWTQGASSMVQVMIILVLAWSLSSVTLPRGVPGVFGRWGCLL